MRVSFFDTTGIQRVERWLIYLALFLTVFGARLWLISTYGSSMPIHDQWDGEARTLFKPYLEGTLQFADLFSPHNEHRIVLSRLLSLFLLKINGQWDSLVEMTANAAICGILAVIVVATLTSSLGWRNRGFIMLGVALWLSLPYAFENTLWGFQSCFYFLILFSWVAIWGIGFHNPLKVQWWLGAIALILACLSMASGFFAAIAVIALLAIRLAATKAFLRSAGGTSVLCFAVVAASLYFQVVVPGHAVLKATSPTAWLTFFGKCLSWPFCDTPFAFLIVYSPLAALAFIYWFERRWLAEGVARRVELLGCIGFWAVLQAAALAYGRGGDGSAAVLSRYMDILAVGCLCNLLALAILFDYVRVRIVRHQIWIGVATLWIAITAFGAIQISRNAVSGIAFRQGYLQDCEKALRSYVETGDLRFIAKDTKITLPYPRLEPLLPVLNDPAIRSILPATAVAPLHLEKVHDVGDTFVRGNYPPGFNASANDQGWSSYSAGEVAKRGTMESQELTSRLPYLAFEVAGYFTRQMSLKLVGLDNNRITNLHVPGRSDGSWRTAYLPVPDKRFRLVAEDNDSSQWFAFQDPGEMGRFSFHTLRLLRQGKKLFAGGAALCLLLAAANVLLLSTRQRSFSPVRDIFAAMRTEQIDGHCLADIVGGGDPEVVAREIIRVIRTYARLSPDDSVLDVGCGCGRIATALTQYIGRDGRYLGLDIVPGLISFASQFVTPRYPQFEFLLLNDANQTYDAWRKGNEKGRSEKISDIVPAQSIDLGISVSLFTHLDFPKALETLVMMRRALKPKGRAFVTAFVLDAEAREAIERRQSLFHFEHRTPSNQLFTEQTDDPTLAVAYDNETLQALIHSAGFRLEKQIRGYWSNSQPGETFQDLLILRNP